jgi:hypothetical protein
LDASIAYRQFLKSNFRIPPRAEIKAHSLIHNTGDMRQAGLSFKTRLKVFKSALSFQRKCGYFRIFAIVVKKNTATVVRDVRDAAWEYAIQRLERFGKASGENIHVLPDEGHVDFIQKKIRRMRRFNRVPSAFGYGSLDRKTKNVIEDPSERKSKESYFIQFADLNAYAAFHKVFPGANVDGRFWDALGDARVHEVNKVRAGPDGIVVWPK